MKFGKGCGEVGGRDEPHSYQSCRVFLSVVVVSERAGMCTCD